MFRFCKIYGWELLKISLVVLGIVCGLFLPLYVAAQSFGLPKILLQAMLFAFPVAGFLAGVAAPFYIEYRGRATVWSFLGEVLLMIIALVFVGGGIFLGVILGAMTGNSIVTSDGSGLAVLFFLLSGALIGIVPGVLLGALATAIWKFLRSGQRNLRPTASL